MKHIEKDKPKFMPDDCKEAWRTLCERLEKMRKIEKQNKIDADIYLSSYLATIANCYKYLANETTNHTLLLYRQPLSIDYHRYVYTNKSNTEVSFYTIYIFNKMYNGKDILFPDGSKACLLKNNQDAIFQSTKQTLQKQEENKMDNKNAFKVLHERLKKIDEMTAEEIEQFI